METTKQEKKEFKAPTFEVVNLERSSTTVLGNCTHWKENSDNEAGLPSPGPTEA